MLEKNDTLIWYHENAEAFIDRTADVDMSDLYRTFLTYMPSGGSIMDLGCGAGSAALFFTQMGYRVLAVDGAGNCAILRKSASAALSAACVLRNWALRMLSTASGLALLCCMCEKPALPA